MEWLYFSALIIISTLLTLAVHWPLAVAVLLPPGVGSAGNNAAYPDLAIGVQDGDTRTHATLSGLWNAAYGIGWAAGPFAGGLLAGRYGFAGYGRFVVLGHSGSFAAFCYVGDGSQALRCAEAGWVVPAGSSAISRGARACVCVAQAGPFGELIGCVSRCGDIVRVQTSQEPSKATRSPCGSPLAVVIRLM